jgi:signal transduction histidine kinase/CheY-like chemotaxis protein
MQTRLLTMALRTEQDVVISRTRARLIAEGLGFSAQDGVRIATAVSEIARNAFRYAREGTVEFTVERPPATRPALKDSFVITVRDRGAGIPNLKEILAGNYRSQTGMGMGLVGAKRLMDGANVDTGGGGTVVRLEKNLPGSVPMTGPNLQALVDRVSAQTSVNPLEELGMQNHELITTLAELNSHREQLENVNGELSETNRGVVALYDELDTVYRVGRVVASKLDLDSLLHAITEATTDVSGADVGAFYYRDQETQEISCQTTAGPMRALLYGFNPATLRDLLGDREDNTEVFRSDDLQKDKAVTLLHNLPFRSFMSVSVRDATGELAGALIFGHRNPNAFSERTERILTSVAVQASIGIENARLYRNVQAASAAKDQFLAVLSHELRTPLSPVFAILASLEHHPALPDDVRSDLAVMKRNLQLEARLIDDLLDLTRIVKGKAPLQKEVTDVHELIYAACQTCDPSIMRQQVRLELELAASLHHVFGDAARLQQVLWNLLSNAVKFTPLKGVVRIATAVADDRELCIRISDTGRGIETAVLESIFRPFEQGDHTVPALFGGLGLGLAISKSIVEAHGGEIRAESDGVGQGATFVIALPLADVTAKATPPQQCPDQDAARRRVKILLVDDHADTRATLQRLLSRRGHEVITASNCEEALHEASNGTFDLVISDLGLPDGSGHDLMPRLRERGLARGIALSGFGMEADVERSRAVGFVAHLIKPLDFSVLESTIEMALGQPHPEG